MQNASDEQGGHGAIKDFICWRRDPLLPGLSAEPNGNSAAARTAWEKANFTVKSAISLCLTEQVKVRAMAYTDDDNKSAPELWKFLESTYTASNEEAIQNLRCQIDSLVYVEGTDWDEHLNKFNSLIVQLGMQNFSMEDKQKKSMLIRSLP